LFSNFKELPLGGRWQSDLFSLFGWISQGYRSGCSSAASHAAHRK
jgi:hypothetical protein